MQVSRFNSYNTYSNQKSNQITKPNNAIQQHSDYKVPFTGISTKITIAGYVAAALVGLVGVTGISIVKNDAETEQMKKEAIYEKVMTDIEKSRCELADIKDTNGDGKKELLFKGKDGRTFIFDVENNQVTVNSDGEIQKEEILKSDK